MLFFILSFFFLTFVSSFVCSFACVYCCSWARCLCCCYWRKSRSNKPDKQRTRYVFIFIEAVIGREKGHISRLFAFVRIGWPAWAEYTSAAYRCYCNEDVEWATVLFGTSQQINDIKSLDHEEMWNDHHFHRLWHVVETPHRRRVFCCLMQILAGGNANTNSY